MNCRILRVDLYSSQFRRGLICFLWIISLMFLAQGQVYSFSQYSSRHVSSTTPSPTTNLTHSHHADAVNGYCRVSRRSRFYLPSTINRQHIAHTRPSVLDPNLARALAGLYIVNIIHISYNSFSVTGDGCGAGGGPIYIHQFYFCVEAIQAFKNPRCRLKCTL